MSSTDFPGEVERDRFRISESLGLVLSPVDTSTSCRAFIFCRRLSIVPSDCIRALSMASACRLICSCNWCCEQQTMPDYHEKVLNVYLYDIYILLLCSGLIPATLLFITDSMPFFFNCFLIKPRFPCIIFMGFYNSPSCLTGLSYHIFGTDASAIQAVKIKESGLNQIYYNCLTPSSLIPSTQDVLVFMCVCSPQEILLFSHLVFHILLRRPPPFPLHSMYVCV